MGDTTKEDVVYDYAVVGAGLIGSAAARHLSRLLKDSSSSGSADSSSPPSSGNGVVLIGPDEPSSEEERKEREVFGAHYDEGRITRVEGSHLTWSQFAKRSIERYRDIEAQSGISFYTEAGYLIVVPKDDDYYKKALAVSESEDLELNVEEVTDFSEHFSYFAVPPGSAGIYERERAGHISPRNLVRAQVKLAAENGCTVIRDVVRSVKNTSSNDDSTTYTLTTKGGQTLRAKKVLLACGAFINHYALLPNGRQLDIGMNPASVCMAEISDRSVEMLKTMPSMYMISGDDDDGLPVYILPPIKYPNGKTYIKIGGCDVPPNWRPDAREIAEWYRSEGNLAATKRLLGVLKKLIPQLEVLSHHPVTCVTTRTETMQLYIDEIASGLYVACGGNGWAAKSSDEIGRVAANLVRDGVLDCKFDRDLFKARFR